jgi:hypothetical protein
MAYTVDGLGDQIAHSVGEDFNDFDIKEMFRQWVTEVIEEILLEADWPFSYLVDSFDTSAASDTYTLGATVADVRSLFRTDINLELSFIPQDELREMNYDIDSVGPPTVWWWRQISSGLWVVQLWPIPDAEYEIYVYGNTQLSTNLTGTTTLPIPSSIYPLIRAGVLALYKGSMGDYPGVQVQRTLFEKYMTKAKARYLTPAARDRVFQYTDVPQSAGVSLRYPATIPATTVPGT